MAPVLTTRQEVHRSRVNLRNVADTYTASEFSSKECAYCKKIIQTNMAMRINRKQYSCIECMIKRIERM